MVTGIGRAGLRLGTARSSVPILRRQDQTVGPRPATGPASSAGPALRWSRRKHSGDLNPRSSAPMFKRCGGLFRVDGGVGEVGVVKRINVVWRYRRRSDVLG